MSQGSVLADTGLNSYWPGTIPSIGSDGVVVGGSNVVQLNAASYAYIPLPRNIMPNGLMTFVAFPGDTAGGIRFIQATACDGNTVALRCTNGGDGGIPNQIVRINWIMLGF